MAVQRQLSDIFASFVSGGPIPVEKEFIFPRAHPG